MFYCLRVNAESSDISLFMFYCRILRYIFVYVLLQNPPIYLYVLLQNPPIYLCLCLIAESSDTSLCFIAESSDISLTTDMSEYIPTAVVANGDFQIYHRILEVSGYLFY